MYERVIVPLDGSKLAEAALGPGVALARHEDASLRLVSVAADETEAFDLQRYLVGLEPDDEDAVPAAERELLVRTDRPAAAILREVRHDAGEILCMATHGRGGLSGALLGSVAEEVVREHEGPVLLVGPNFRRDWPVMFLNLLVCLDGSELSEAILPAAIAWARNFGMQIWLVHVAPPPPAPDAELPPDRERMHMKLRESSDAPQQQYLAHVAEELRGRGVDVRCKVLHGASPAAVICSHAARVPGAVLALATKGRSGFDRLAMGSVALKVAHHSPVPILVVRERVLNQGHPAPPVPQDGRPVGVHRRSFRHCGSPVPAPGRAARWISQVP